MSSYYQTGSPTCSSIVTVPATDRVPSYRTLTDLGPAFLLLTDEGNVAEQQQLFHQLDREFRDFRNVNEYEGHYHEDL